MSGRQDCDREQAGGVYTSVQKLPKWNSWLK
jgi:hypothetical protein